MKPPYAQHIILRITKNVQIALAANKELFIRICKSELTIVRSYPFTNAYNVFDLAMKYYPLICDKLITNVAKRLYKQHQNEKAEIRNAHTV